MTVAPFRAPHHTASVSAIVGGGSSPRPGEASLAHRGVLFLDELAEFPRNALEALRQPLEDGAIAIARVGGRLVFPARFQLVATMNLCPCGARGDPAAECSCSAARLPPTATSCRGRCSIASTCSSRCRDRARGSSRRRGRELRSRPVPGRGCSGTRAAGAAERSAVRTNCSARRRAAAPFGARRARVARVARTAALLAGAKEVAAEHVAEAFSFRAPTELGPR